MHTRFIESYDGKRLRTAIWEAGEATAARGLLVLLDGQTEFLGKYAEVVAELTARGFAVASLDWRGQGGSERLLSDPLKAHVEDFADYEEDLAAFMDRVVKPLTQHPPLALAHSMGGHILLRALHGRPGMFRAAVTTAPMLRVQTRGFPHSFARAVCYLENLAGRRDDWVWGMAKRDPLKLSFEDNLVTSDRARFARNAALLAAEPHLRLAGPSWGWLEAAYRSMNRLMASGVAEAIETPVLVVGAGRDRIVDTQAARQFARRLPRGTYLEIPDAEHEILMENDSIRARFWKAFDAFAERYV